ncbi:dihydrodipicolinate synthase family protein [Streptomyces malaysiensis]|uniref:dihydrodipicolinate synthase family protein n=1 Tax=Streptomyces malaysiensis TaxID=92644 RepID=UPI0034488972
MLVARAFSCSGNHSLVAFSAPGNSGASATPSTTRSAQGAISATLTVVPELCLQQWDAVQRGDIATALELHNKQLPIWRAIDGPNMTPRIKAALAMQGRNGGHSLSPLTPVSDTERETLRTAFKAADIKVTN